VLGYLREAVARASFGELTDAELLERYASSRDGDAFATLLRRYGQGCSSTTCGANDLTKPARKTIDSSGRMS
jgi:hypothetical protein